MKSSYTIIAILGAALLVGSVVTYVVVRPPETFEKCVLDATRDHPPESRLSAAFYCNQRVGITWLDWYHVFREADYSTVGAFIFACGMELKSSRERQKVLTQPNAHLRERQLRQGTE